MTQLNTEHLYRIDLSSGPTKVTLSQPLMHQDAQADTFIAALRRGMFPVDLTDASVCAYMHLTGSDTTIFLTGEAQGSRARVTLAEECYTQPGRFTLSMQVLRDDVRHTVLQVEGEIARTGSGQVVSPEGTLPSVAELLTEIDNLRDATEAADQAITAAQDAAREANEAASDASDAIDRLLGAAADASQAYLDEQRPMVYCWGDSLTEGVGGWLATPEGVQKAIVSAYPDVVSQTYPCVNLGCRGETIQTIMARQGADPMVVGGFTIPASATESVVVGYQRGGYYADNVLGLATASGDLAQPLKECEAGVNPCTIAGVEGILLRDGEEDSEGRHAYRFHRLTAGSAVAVPAGTTIETYAMKHYRNGIAVIWMGANGAVNSHAAYLEKIRQMVEYGKYQNYLVLLCREYAAQWVLEDTNSIKKGLTDADGTCHLLYLKPELLERGYPLAGIAASTGVPNTSGWTGTTDEIKLQRPLLMASTGSSESSYETLHFSCYGYKAIGKLVVERLGELIRDMIDAPRIISHPVSVTAKLGTTVAFIVKATGADLTYQWQYSNDEGETWGTASGAGNNTATMTLTAEKFRNGYLYRCLVTNGTGKRIASNSAKLTVTEVEVPQITSHPASVTAQVGTNATFSVTATGTGLSYLWQYSKDEGVTWSSAGGTGNNTATMTLAAETFRNGYLYRCMVTNSAGKSIASNSARLTVIKALTPDIVTNGTDAHGTYLCKTTRALTGTGDIIDTGCKPYDTEKDWTILCRFSDTMTPSDGNLGSIFEMREHFPDESIQTAVYLRKDVGSDGTVNYNLAGGFGGFHFPVDNAPGYTAPTDGWHELSIIKEGNNYSFRLDGGLAYGSPLGYAVTQDHLSDATVYLFGRVEDGTVHNTITGTIGGFRMYSGAMTAEAAQTVLTEMKAEVT